MDLDVAFDDDGRLLGVRGEMIHDEGAYTPQGINLPYNDSTALPGPYMLPAYQLEVRVAGTNRVATMPVRGAGYPEGASAMERLLDRIADELGLDRAKFEPQSRAPEKMPYVSPLKTRPGRRWPSTAANFSAVSAWRSTPSIMPALPRAKRTRAPKVAISASGSATA